MDKAEIIERWCHIAENSDSFLSLCVKELVLEKGIALREINIAAEILNRRRRDEIFNTSRLVASDVLLLGDIHISLVRLLHKTSAH